MFGVQTNYKGRDGGILHGFDSLSLPKAKSYMGKACGFRSYHLHAMTHCNVDTRASEQQRNQSLMYFSAHKFTSTHYMFKSLVTEAVNAHALKGHLGALGPVNYLPVVNRIATHIFARRLWKLRHLFGYYTQNRNLTFRFLAFSGAY